MTVPSMNATQFCKHSLFSKTADANAFARVSMYVAGLSDVNSGSCAFMYVCNPSRKISASCGANFQNMFSMSIHLSSVAR